MVPSCFLFLPYYRNYRTAGFRSVHVGSVRDAQNSNLFLVLTARLAVQHLVHIFAFFFAHVEVGFGGFVAASATFLCAYCKSCAAHVACKL